jgi:hypothetical protein
MVVPHSGTARYINRSTAAYQTHLTRRMTGKTVS